MPRRPFIPWIVLGFSLFMTVAATWSLAYSVNKQDSERMDNAIQSVLYRIQSRMDTYVALIRSGAGMFETSRQGITREDFQLFAQGLEIRRFYPGIQGIGYTHRFNPQNRDSLYAAMHAQGFPEFTWRPQSGGTEGHAIIYLEPLDRRNQAAIGYDMFSEPTRRLAMARARDSAYWAMTGAVTLVQEIEGRKQAGFLIYRPVYRGRGTPETVEERRRLLLGFVYAPFRADDLFKGIFGTAERSRLAFKIYDGTRPTEENLLHDSRLSDINPLDSTEYVRPTQLHMGGQTWTITFSRTRLMAAESRQPLVLIIAFVGLLLSLTLFSLSRVQVRAENAARDQAARVAAEAREERLRLRALELERTNRELREFTYIASHDLQEPLRKISTFTDLLQHEYGHEFSAESGFYLNRLGNTAERLAHLLRDLLTYSLMTTEARPFEVVDLNRVLNKVLHELKPLLEETGGSVEIQDMPVIQGDGLQLKHLFYNMLNNGLKFHRDGVAPRVLVTAEIDEVPFSMRNVEVCRITIEDNGIGFEEKYLDRIFAPFQRLNDRDRYEGTGIGLTIARRVVERHEGFITASSIPGEGSRFEVLLPLMQREELYEEDLE